MKKTQLRELWRQLETVEPTRKKQETWSDSFTGRSAFCDANKRCWPVCACAVQDAGVAYKQCGRMEEKLKKPEVAASFYHEAALCFRKDDPQGDVHARTTKPTRVKSSP